MLSMLSKTRNVAGSTFIATSPATRRRTTTRSALGTVKRALVYGLLGSSVALGRPLSSAVQASGVVADRGCVTSVTEHDRREMEAGLLEARSAMMGAWTDDGIELDSREAQVTRGPLKNVVLDVYFHVVYANETIEGGYVPDDQVHEQITVLNSAYKSTNISYNLVNITRIENEDWFTNVWPGSPQEEEMKRVFHKGNSSVLNIFTAGFNATDRSLGYSSLPSSYLREPLKDGLIIRYSTLPGGTHKNYNLGHTMVHELGHWLGLYHTFEGGCTGVGDNVDDTAPESSGAEGCPVGRKSCANSTEPDPIHNYMDYSFDSCMTHFTPGQAVRMHEAIWAFRTQRPPVANTTSTPSETVQPSAGVTPSAPGTTTAPVESGSPSPAPSVPVTGIETQNSDDDGADEEEEGYEEEDEEPQVKEDGEEDVGEVAEDEEEVGEAPLGVPTEESESEEVGEDGVA